ncbi:ABC transporter permease [Rugosimonospora acidiphila]|uniref:ABC transporter permease n=1 Tax=Rugosimonospora acidiphila TaxID=556531 RepID=A0ABP9RXR4_9ACTN
MPADIVPTQPAPADRSGGVIHDIGYQRYSGSRLGRGYASRALYVHSLRTAFGLGRSAKAKIFPWLVVGLVFVVAMVAVAVRAESNQVVLSYLQFTDTIGLPLLLFLAVVAPELVSRDLRSRVLPLYFSRPLRRDDYALAKLAAMTSAFWLLLAAPQLLMLIGGVFSRKDGFGGAMDEVMDFLGGIGYAAIVAIVFSSLGILLASLSGRRAVSAAVVAAVYLVTTPVAAVLQTLGGTVGKIAPVINPIDLVEGLEAWLYHRSTGIDIGNHGYLYLIVAVVLVAVYVTLLLVRYRKVAA